MLDPALRSRHRPARFWTISGLAVALLGIPATVQLFRLLPSGDAAMLAREFTLLALGALLLVIVLKGERRPLSSVGLSFRRPGRSLVWGVLLACACFAALVACLGVFSLVGLSYGEGAGVSPSLGVVAVTVFRAGVVEELFYRGFAIERLTELGCSRWIAATFTSLAFAGFHYRQGVAGMVLALVLGALLTGFYLWKRDLLAAMTGHFLVDFVPNVLLPLMAGE